MADFAIKNPKKKHLRHVDKTVQMPDSKQPIGTHQEPQTTDEARAMNREHRAAEYLDRLLDRDIAKDCAHRLSAWKEVVSSLRGAFLPDFVDKYKATLADRLLHSFKKGIEEEVAVACHAASLCALTLGSNGSLLEELEAQLTLLIKDHAKPEADRAAAIETMAMLAFVSPSEDDAATRQLLATLEHLVGLHKPSTKRSNIVRAPPAVIVQALKSWCLLASSLAHHETLAENCLSYFFSLLDSKDLSVRIAAGEAIALLLSTSPEPHMTPQHEQEDEAKSTSFEATTIHGVNLARVVDKLAVLSRGELVIQDEQQAKMSRDERRQQQQAFGIILASVKGENFPEESFVVAHASYKVRGWMPVVQLRALRAILQEGLPVHLQYNSLLDEILDLSAHATSTMADVLRDPMVDSRLAATMLRTKDKNRYERDTRNRRMKQAFLDLDPLHPLIE
jgi:hypothetical protein